MDQALLTYMLEKSRWLYEKSRIRIEKSRKSLARSDAFIMEAVGNIVQYDIDHRRGLPPPLSPKFPSD